MAVFCLPVLNVKNISLATFEILLCNHIIGPKYAYVSDLFVLWIHQVPKENSFRLSLKSHFEVNFAPVAISFDNQFWIYRHNV